MLQTMTQTQLGLDKNTLAAKPFRAQVGTVSDELQVGNIDASPTREFSVVIYFYDRSLSRVLQSHQEVKSH